MQTCSCFWVQNCKNDGFTKKRIRDPEKAVLIISYPSNTVIHTFLFIRDNYIQSMYRLVRRHKWKKDIVKTVYQQPERGFCFDEPSTFSPIIKARLFLKMTKLCDE